jgi:hypothetical protein
MIEEVISLKDLVTGPATEMLEGVTKLRHGIEELKHGFKHLDPEKIAEGLKGISSGVGLIIGPVAELGEKVLEFGKEMAETALEAAELKEQLLATFSALAGGEEAGAATLGMLNDLSAELGVTRASIVPAAKAFQAMGYTDLGALRGQIEAVTSATALFGEEGGSAYTRIVSAVRDAAEAHTKLELSTRQLRSIGGLTGTVVTEAARRMGLTTAQFAARLKAGTVDAGKFGDALQEAFVEKGRGPLEAMANTLPNLLGRLKENFSRLFEDVDVKPFTDALKSFFDIFQLSKPSGQALQRGILPVMNRLFQLAGRLVMGIKHLTLDIIILGLKAYIALKPIVRTVQEWSERFGVLHGIVLAVKIALGILAIVVGVVVAAIVVAGVALGAFVSEMGRLGGEIIGFVGKAWDVLADWATSGYKIAADFVSGLVDGITGGIGRAVTAVEDLGGALKDRIKSLLGIHSPSKVMLEMGMNVTDGFALGIKQGAGGVGRAADDAAMAANDNMVPSGSYAPSASKSATSSTSSSSSITVTVEPGAIVIHGDGRGTVELTEEAVSLIFERIAASQGAA